MVCDEGQRSFVARRGGREPLVAVAVSAGADHDDADESACVSTPPKIRPELSSTVMLDAASTREGRQCLGCVGRQHSNEALVRPLWRRAARLAPSYGPAPAGQYSSTTVQQDVSLTTGATTATGDSHHYCRRSDVWSRETQATPRVG